MTTNNRGAFESRNFNETLSAVKEGSIPFATLLEHPTYKLRARKICKFFAPAGYEDDVFQILSMRVCKNSQKLCQVKDEEEFFRWVSVVAKNISIDMFRMNDRSRENDTLSDEEQIIPDTSTPSPYLMQAIKEWIDLLPPLRRRIVQIYTENHGISSREVAKLLAEQGIKRSHATIAKEFAEAMKSCLEIVEKIGRHKQKKIGRRKQKHVRSA